MSSTPLTLRQNSVYVAYPNKAQSAINKAKLEPQSMSLLNPAPDSFDLQLDNMFVSHSSMKAKLDPFTGDLRLPDSDEAFVRINVPAIEAANGSIAHIEQRVQIANMDQFNAYTRKVLLSEEYSIYLKGKGGLKYGSLPKTTVKYNKKITMKGKPDCRRLIATSLLADIPCFSASACYSN